jgi:hypothetical protein
MTEGRRTATQTKGVSRPATRTGRGLAAEDGDRMAELEARLARLENAPDLRARGRGVMARVIPDEATHHFRNAGREQLLGVRSIVDFWIERIDQSEGRSTRGTRHESIDID